MYKSYFCLNYKSCFCIFYALKSLNEVSHQLRRSSLKESSKCILPGDSFCEFIRQCQADDAVGS